MKNYTIAEDKKNELMAYLGELPFKISNPIVSFLSMYLAEVIETVTEVAPDVVTPVAPEVVPEVIPEVSQEVPPLSDVSLD